MLIATAGAQEGQHHCPRKLDSPESPVRVPVRAARYTPNSVKTLQGSLVVRSDRFCAEPLRIDWFIINTPSKGKARIDALMGDNRGVEIPDHSDACCGHVLSSASPSRQCRSGSSGCDSGYFPCSSAWP